MFNSMVNDFDAHMISNRLMRNFDHPSSLFWSDEEQNDQSYYLSNDQKTRVVWITNYLTNEDFPIHVSIDDPLLHMVNGSSSTVEQELLLSNGKDDASSGNHIHSLDLSKLNLDDLLLLLYRLQQRTTKNVVTTSDSMMSTSSSSSSDFLERQSSKLSPLHSLSPTLSHAVQSSLSMLNNPPSYSHPINRRQSSLTLSNIADAPKQLMPTLVKPISSFHSTHSNHIHSPNDVVDKLLQSFHLRKSFAGHQTSPPFFQLHLSRMRTAQS